MITDRDSYTIVDFQHPLSLITLVNPVTRHVLRKWLGVTLKAAKNVLT